MNAPITFSGSFVVKISISVSLNFCLNKDDNINKSLTDKITKFLKELFFLLLKYNWICANVLIRLQVATISI